MPVCALLTSSLLKCVVTDEVFMHTIMSICFQKVLKLTIAKTADTTDLNALLELGYWNLIAYISVSETVPDCLTLVDHIEWSHFINYDLQVLLSMLFNCFIVF